MFRGGNPQVLAQPFDLDIMPRAEIGFELFKVARQHLLEDLAEKIPYSKDDDSCSTNRFGDSRPVHILTSHRDCGPGQTCFAGQLSVPNCQRKVGDTFNRSVLNAYALKPDVSIPSRSSRSL